MNNDAFLPDIAIHVPVDGGELAVFRYGPGGGQPVLLIHGITSSNRAWQWMAQGLIERGLTPYAVDLRGRADSSHLPPPFGQKAHVKDLLAVMDFLGYPSMDVIGHSSGAFVGVALLGLAPERVNKLVLIDGGIQFPLPEGVTIEQVLAYVLGPAFARLAMTYESKEAYRDYWKAQPAFVRGWSKGLDEYVDFDLRGTPPLMKSSVNPKCVEDDTSENFKAFDLNQETLRNLKNEVLLIRAERGLQNEETPLYPLPILTAELEKFPKVRLETVADTNHYDLVVNSFGAEKCLELIYGGGKI
jgi:pimeloyl-ACP methyl ester carboxylesterase